MTIRGIRKMGEMNSFDHVIKYKAYLELVTPMHVGASFSEKNEVLLHPVDGLPFVQASSIAGSLRDYYTKEKGDKRASELFGSSDVENGSRIIVSDGNFDQKSVKFEMRPRVKIDPESGTTSKSKAKGTDASSGHKFDMECVASGSKFSFELYIKGNDFSEAGDVEDILSAFNQGGITIGGQKSNGFGDVKISRLLCRKFDLTSGDDRKDWIIEDSLDDGKYDDITSSLAEKKSFAYRITGKAKTESGILVKGYKKDGFGQGSADAVNIQDANGNYIIPGSSLKGSLRSQIERILTYKGIEGDSRKQVITNIFGETESGGKAGNIISYDAVIEIPEGKKLKTNNRIHIDKATGGVMNTGLFNEQRAFGNIGLKIDITGRNNPELSCGYMLMAIRDLAINLYNLGGGYSIGNGMLSIDSIDVETKDGKATLDFKNGEITGDKSIVDRCIKATGEV